MLSRRNFLRSLPFLPSAAKRVAASLSAAPAPTLSPVMWMQTTRTTSYMTAEYEAALAAILKAQPLRI